MKGLVPTLCAGLAAVARVSALSSMFQDDEQDVFTFTYTTDVPADDNWVGIYPAGKCPVDGEPTEDATVWKYAPGPSDSVWLSPDGLEEGAWEACFLDIDYKILPYNVVEIEVTGSSSSKKRDEDENENVDTFTTEIEYSTDSPDATNWVGVWPQGSEPTDGTKTTDAIAWQYAKQTSGKVEFAADKLGPGVYTGVFLREDGYEQIGDTFEVHVPVRFYTRKPITLAAQQAGRVFALPVGGLLGNPDYNSVKFEIEDAPDWLQMGKKGLIEGYPEEAGDVTVSIIASTTDSKDTLEVTIPVVKETASEIKVMTYNLWHRGTQVNNYHAKQVAFLAESNADIISLQETDKERTEALASALGYFATVHDSHSTGIISRWKTEVIEQLSIGLGVGVDQRANNQDTEFEGATLSVWNVHLGYDPYGPYDFCRSGMDLDEVLSREAESGRTGQINETVTSMADYLEKADETPVLLMGDFNSPSQLDWTDENPHCGIGFVPWPASSAPLDADMIDSLREVYPDPKQDPHNTWSPIVKENDEPQDRIDHVYHKGKTLKATSADTLVKGEPKPEPDHEDNEWTSDHKAVVVTYSL